MFFAAQVLPGDPARAILGPLAAESSVKALAHQLGTDKPLLDQYWTWISGVVQGDLGTSYQYHAPIGPLLTSALGNSLKLAAVAFVLVVPLGIAQAATTNYVALGDSYSSGVGTNHYDLDTACSRSSRA